MNKKTRNTSGLRDGREINSGRRLRTVRETRRYALSATYVPDDSPHTDVVRGVLNLCEHHSHGLERPFEWVENEPKLFESNDAQKRLVARFTEDDRGVAVALGKSDVTFGYVPIDRCSIGQREGNAPLRNEVESLPDIVRNERVN
jgi:hypothetical protein